MHISLRILSKIAVLALFLFIASPLISRPLRAAAAGSLIKSSRFSAVYYLGDDNRRYVFPNESIYYSWYQNFQGVNTVSDAELSSYAIGGNIKLRAGTSLVKVISDPAVYAAEPGGKLRRITSEAQARALYGPNWAKRVIDLPDSLFVDYTSGQALADDEIPAGSLVKSSGLNAIYYYDGVHFRHIVNMAALVANRFNEKYLLNLPVPSAKIGESILGQESALRDPNGISDNALDNYGSGQGGAPSNNGSNSGNQAGENASQVVLAGNLIHSQGFAIPANVENGDIVGEINHFWKDLEKSAITYSLNGGNGAFSVDGSGVIKVADKTKVNGTSIPVIVRAVSGGKTEEATMTVRLLPAANTIFIDPMASSNGDGTRARPLKSWKGISISSGKNYLQKRGTSETLSARINIGDKDNVLLGAYGNAAQKPILQIQNLKGGTNAAVSMTGDNNTVRDLDLDAKLSTAGIYSGGGDYNRIENVRIRYSEWGLRTLNAAKGFKLLDSEISYTGDDGHYSQNQDDMEIAYNYIHHVNQHWNENSYWYKGKSEASAPGDGIQLNGTIVNFNIHHNIIDRADTDNKFCVIVSPVQDGKISNGRLEYNYCNLRSGGNESGFYIYKGVFGAKVRYNTFVNGTGVYSHSSDLVVSNNTFIRSRLYTQFGGDKLVFDNDFRN
ncbi:MAG: hypothetical protein ACM3PZ_02915 [Bacillota bacterium]